ncbi:hypothetical protein RvY_03583 [Ramazzottius varieornatus]|uniref:Shugoshin C-terminal domain-containing protein n=1 Tax=Ramazzottius varieornatus TaxID=947166 RepID=A0A1D1USB0_RAMVA|nr:hypothetical protein RvY_03583 [Ramazzottius varieornatus]
MAHSPAPKPRRDKTIKQAGKIPQISTATCKYAFTYQTRARRDRKRHRRSRFLKLYRRFRLFRIGYNTARKRLEEGRSMDAVPARKEIVKIIHYEQDPKLLEYLKRAEANNNEWTRENAKLKGERAYYQNHVNEIYRAELDLYEISVKLEDFQRKYAQALVHMEAHGIATTNFTQFLPGYRRIADGLPGVRRVATELALPLRSYSSTLRHVKYYPDEVKCYPLNEEQDPTPIPAPRTASRSWFGSSSQHKKTEGKRHCRRYSVAPGELDRVVRAPAPPANTLVEEEAEPEVESPARSTPKNESREEVSPEKDQLLTPKKQTKIKQSTELGHVSVLTSPEIPLPSELVQETVEEEAEEAEEKKENIQCIPANTVGNKKRSFETLNKVENRTPNRRPTGICASPRLSVGARLSLRTLSMGDNGEAKSSSGSSDDEVEEDDDSGAKSDVSLPSVRSLMASEASQDRDYTDEEEEVSVRSLSTLSLDESSGDASLALSQRSGRPQRAARAKIQSMKEPSLNTKMRRPANVPSLHTPSRERRTESSKGTSKKATQETRSKSVAADDE